MNPMTVLGGPVAAELLCVLLVLGVGYVLLFALVSFAFWRIRNTIPSAENWQGSKIYRSWINARTGTIFHEAGDFTWRFDPVGFSKSPDFVVYGSDEHEVLRIYRHRRFLPTFHVIETGKIVGVIRLKSLLLNRYTLELSDGTRWTFVMPLFTVHFRGDLAAGERIWIRMGPSKRQWNILVPPDFDRIQVLATIAFIHRRWYL